MNAATPVGDEARVDFGAATAGASEHQVAQVVPPMGAPNPNTVFRFGRSGAAVLAAGALWFAGSAPLGARPLAGNTPLGARPLAGNTPLGALWFAGNTPLGARPLGAAPLATARAAPAPEDRANELWYEGKRLEAIDALARRLAEASAAVNGSELDADRRRLAEWQMQVHRYQGALATLESLGADAAPLRGEAHYALTQYEQALTLLEPDNPRHALLRVDALEALGRLEEAGAELDRAEALLGDDEPRLPSFQGRRLAREGEHAAAIERFRTALAVDPVDQRARFGLGRSLLATGDRAGGVEVLAEHRRLVPLVDALEFAQQGLDLAPNHGPNHAGLAAAEAAVGLLDRADTSFGRATQLARAEELTPITLRRARFLEDLRTDRAAAIQVLEAAFERVADVRLAVRAGDTAGRGGERALARQWYLRALELRPNDPGIRQRLDGVEDESR